MKRILSIPLLAAALWVPAFAASERFEILASAAQTASGNGNYVSVSGFRELTVFVNVTAGSGTLSAFSVYLESSDDGGSTWYELVADWRVKNTGTAAQLTADALKRNIVDGSVETAIVTSGKWTAVYTKFGDRIRARWLITPTSSPSETFSVKAVGKN